MKFKVISSNIRFDNPTDGLNRWENRKPHLGQLITQFAPDLLSTQEGRLPQIEQLTQVLPNLQLATTHRPWISYRMYPCIFFNPHTIEIIDSGDIWLSKTPQLPGSLSFKSSFPRLATWIKAQFKESQKHFVYINTHLDHVLGYTRLKQIQVLLKELTQINTDNFPMIVTGDFNESPLGKTRKKLMSLAPNLYDPWIQFNHQEESSYHSFTGKNEKGTRIDWILPDLTFKCLQIQLDKTTFEGRYPSDHFPLKAIFED